MSEGGRSVLLMVEDDDSHATFALRALERSEDLEVHVVATLADARAFLQARDVDLVLSDLKLPDGSGLDLLSTGVPLVVQTSQGDEARAVAALKGGALDYCVKSPETFRELPRIVERALLAGRNLRERRRAEQSLRESDERFRQLAENITQAFWLYDKTSGQIIYASPAWATVYGDCVKTLDGRLAFVHPEDLRALEDGPRAASAVSAEYRVVCDGRVRWIEERIFPIYDASGEPYRMAGLAADVTKRRELEGAVRQAQKMQAVGQLAGGIAHDFNNMLAAVMSAADELALHVGTESQRQLCTLILQASERAAELTRNLLSFSRMGMVRNAAVDVHAVIREVAALLTRSIDRRIVISVELSAHAHGVSGDAAQLQSALLNLGINARDAMPSGGQLRIATQLVQLDAAACETLGFEITPGDFLRVSVCDSGTGIAEHVLPHIYEPFFTTKEPGQGTGIGLAAVYGTVVEHGGALAVRSQLGLGTEFDVYLPLRAAAETSSEVVRSTPDGKGLVLLVDDEPLVLTTASQLLRSIGYEVVTARDGQEAFEKFALHRSQLVAVICDAVMPRESGPEVLQRIAEAAPYLPCVLCSGFSKDTRPAATGSQWVLLPKPFRRADLALTLSQAIAARASMRNGGGT
jgi:two-component system cell cycle sensor histidine kinase/response regulator CckA